MRTMKRSLLSILFLLLLSLTLVQSQSTTTDSTLVNCTLCFDGSEPNDLDARSVFGDITASCREVYNNGTILLPETNCTFLQGIGNSTCSCGTELPAVNDCTLCEDGTGLPEALLEAFPDETCAEVQVDSRRDEESNCVHYQSVVGHYCGCNNPDATQDVCRICGNSNDLPSPQLIGANGLSCMELELIANINGDLTACSAAQSAYSDTCCPATPSPTAVSSAHSARRRMPAVAASAAAFMFGSGLI